MKGIKFVCRTTICFTAVALLFCSFAAQAQETVGILYVTHGGYDVHNSQRAFDVSVQQFSYRPDHVVHQYIVWNSAFWYLMLQSEMARYYDIKDLFMWARMGGIDPFHGITDVQFAGLEAALNAHSCSGITFVMDQAFWMTGDRILNNPYPRFIYNPPDYLPGTPSNMTYCGEAEPDGPWAGCDPERFNVDGPAERFVAAGVDRIIAVDMTVGGVRFFKTYDVIQRLKLALADIGRSDIPVSWVNDPTNLMEQSYPTDPLGIAGYWTPDKGTVNVDPSIPLATNPNPIAEDPDLALLHVQGIEAHFAPGVADADTAVLLLNHATMDWAQYYDPKIDDTLVVNQNIKSLLLARHPTMDPNNIIGAFMGIQEDGTAEGVDPPGTVERTRRMRGENLGHAWLYEQPNGTLPGAEWGYLYWDALELLKNRGVQHIVIGFPQVVASSFYDQVEWPNQIAKEIGYKNWDKWGTFDYVAYPGVGHPFSDYWGMWVNTDCGGVPCCFEMGGCGDPARPYPPPRQTTGKRDVFDPSLAYDVSEFGHLGYDPALGVPDPNMPVQDQYAGTWAMFTPANDAPGLVALLEKHVLDAVGCEVTPVCGNGILESGEQCEVGVVDCAAGNVCNAACQCEPVTLIELTAFTATGGNRQVTLRWRTEAETDHAGFNIYRTESKNGAYTKINTAIIPAQGSPTEGASYSFVDSGVKNRKRYSYKLEDVDLNGSATLHGPVRATPRLLSLGK